MQQSRSSKEQIHVNCLRILWISLSAYKVVVQYMCIQVVIRYIAVDPKKDASVSYVTCVLLLWLQIEFKISKQWKDIAPVLKNLTIFLKPFSFKQIKSKKAI